MPRVLLTDHPWPELDIERQILTECGAELIDAPSGDEATLATLAVDADAILTCWACVTERVISAGRSLRVVSRMGIGLDNIDVAAATARGIPVTNVPDYCVTEVAEHALGLILALGRNIAWQHAETKAGRYQLGSGPQLRRLQGQTLGIVGWGRIGQALAARAAALGLNVLASSRRSGMSSVGVKFVSLSELLTASDFVSLHLPLTPESRNLIGPRKLALMKPTAFLINTARGGLVDHDALAAALDAGKLAGAGLDVQQPEPPDLSQPPWNDPRVIITPHAAFVSAESLVELRTRATTQVATVLRGGVPENIVNGVQ